MFAVDVMFSKTRAFRHTRPRMFSVSLREDVAPTPPWQHRRGNTAVATPPWQHRRGNTAVATPPWQHRRGNTAVATPPWQHRRGNTAVATPPWQHRRGNTAVATPPWQHRRGNTGVWRRHVRGSVYWPRIADSFLDRNTRDTCLTGRWLFATPPRPNALLWLFRCTNLFTFCVSFRVSISFRVKLDYIRLD